MQLHLSSLIAEWNFEFYNYVVLHIVHSHAWDTSIINNLYAVQQ